VRNGCVLQWVTSVDGCLAAAGALAVLAEGLLSSLSCCEGVNAAGSEPVEVIDCPGSLVGAFYAEA